MSTSGRSGRSDRLGQRWNETVLRLVRASSGAASSTTGWRTVPPSLRTSTVRIHPGTPRPPSFW